MTGIDFWSAYDTRRLQVHMRCCGEPKFAYDMRIVQVRMQNFIEPKFVYARPSLHVTFHGIHVDLDYVECMCNLT